MSTNKDTIDYFLECLTGIPDLRAKAMFGEYRIYSGNMMFALVCDNTLFLKIYPETIHLFEDTETKAYPGSRNTAQINPEWLENREILKEIVEVTLKCIPLQKIKKEKYLRFSIPFSCLSCALLLPNYRSMISPG